MCTELFPVDSEGPLGLGVSDLQRGNSCTEGGEVCNKVCKPPPKSAPNDSASSKEETLVGRASCSIFASVFIHSMMPFLLTTARLHDKILNNRFKLRVNDDELTLLIRHPFERNAILGQRSNRGHDLIP